MKDVSSISIHVEPFARGFVVREDEKSRNDESSCLAFVKRHGRAVNPSLVYNNKNVKNVKYNMGNIETMWLN